MISQREYWPLTGLVPEVDYEDESFNLDAKSALYLILLLGIPIKTITNAESRDITITMKHSEEVVIRRREN
jgi:hypothetical protein